MQLILLNFLIVYWLKNNYFSASLSECDRTGIFPLEQVRRHIDSIRIKMPLINIELGLIFCAMMTYKALSFTMQESLKVEVVGRTPAFSVLFVV